MKKAFTMISNYYKLEYTNVLYVKNFMFYKKNYKYIYNLLFFYTDVFFNYSIDEYSVNQDECKFEIEISFYYLNKEIYYQKNKIKEFDLLERISNYNNNFKILKDVDFVKSLMDFIL